MAPKQVECPRCGTRNIIPAAACSGCGVGLEWVLRYWDEYVSGPRKSYAPLLLVSDPHSFKELYSLTFERLGVSCRFAEAEEGDAFQTIELARRLQPNLIITALLRAEGMQGDQMIRELRSMPATYAIPILLITGTVNHPLFGAALDAGATWYVPKPFAPRELTHTVASILAGGPAVWIIHPGVDRAACRAMEDQQWRIWTYDMEAALSDPGRMARILKPDVVAVEAGVSGAVLSQLKADPEFGHVPVMLLAEETNPELESWAYQAGADSIYCGPLDANGLLSAIRPVLQKSGRI